MYFVTFTEGDETLDYAAYNMDEAVVIRDFLCSGGFDAVIIRWVKE